MTKKTSAIPPEIHDRLYQNNPRYRRRKDNETARRQRGDKRSPNDKRHPHDPD